MLTYDPRKRISAQEALDDPWMQKNQKNDTIINKKALVNLSSFSVTARWPLKPNIHTFSLKIS